MITGYFCEMSSGHRLMFVGATDPGPLGGESDVFLDGNLIGRYVDDSIGTPDVIQTRINELRPNWANLYVGVPPALWGRRYDGAHALQEVYPWTNPLQSKFILPEHHSFGYILQAYNRLQDGVEGAEYPTEIQQHKLWCAIRKRTPQMIIWYFDQPDHRAQLRQAMRSKCS